MCGSQFPSLRTDEDWKRKAQWKPKEKEWAVAQRYGGETSGRETEKVVFALLSCKLVAAEPNETRESILCDLHFLLKLFGISCQH